MHSKSLNGFLFLIGIFCSLPADSKGAENSCYDDRGQAQKCVPEFVNAAFNVSVESTNICGLLGPAEYCLQTGVTGLRKSCKHYCDANSPRDQHPARFMTDFDTYNNRTWWQSETMATQADWLGPNRRQDVNLTLSLGKAFDITYIRLRFHSSRPESFAMYKRTSEDSEWEAYQYFSASCYSTYGVEFQQDITVNQQDIAVCTDEYSDISPLTGGTVPFSTLEGRPDRENFENSQILQEWVTATDIRISLLRMNTFGDEIFRDKKVLSSYFYAIDDLAVGARCKCNGHANSCVTGQGRTIICNCEHNTTGPDCNMCKPFYNDRQWARATEEDGMECLPCDCNGKSNECYFDEQLYNETGHGGHCTNCRDYRDGIHCEKCLPSYYVHPRTNRCTAVAFCGQPTEVDGAVFVNTEYSKLKTFKHGSVVHYTCDYGRYFDGYHNNRTCNHGRWTEPDFKCKWQTCTYIDHPKNGRRLDWNSEPAQHTEFKCDEGYTMKGPKTMFCRVGGSWRPADPPTCHRQTCTYIDHPKNGRRLDWNSEPAQHTEFKCDEGYTMKGPKTMFCRVGGSWRPADPPTCHPVFCPEPFDIEHGQIFQESVDGIYNDFGSVVTYTCDDFYILKGLAARRCMADGQWEEDEPICYQTPCDPFVDFKNGTVTYTGDPIKIGTIAFIKCDPRADMEPDIEYVICLPKGEWNEKPRCLVRLPVKSDRKREIRRLNGNRWFWVGQEQWIRSGGKIRVTCSRDYELYHNGYLVQTPKVCQNSVGTWRPPLPTCKEKRCDVPPFSDGHNEYENGTVAVGKVEHGVKLKTVCNELYEVKHHGTTTCDKGKLEKPSCIEKRCKLPKKTSIVTYIRTGRPYGLTVIDHTYKIHVGCTDKEYELRLRNKDTQSFEYPPDFSAVCHYGILPDFPTCEEKRCNIQQFDQKNFSTVTYGDGKAVNVNIIESGVTVRLDCSEGYHFKDGRKDKEIDVRCSKGKLIGVIECEPDPCPKPNVPNAVLETMKEEYSHGTQADIVCEDGFEITPDTKQALATCSHGKWLDAPKECVETDCRLPKTSHAYVLRKRANGVLGPGDSVPSSAEVDVICDLGFELDNGDNEFSAKCTRGVWDTLFPHECFATNCRLPKTSHAYVLRKRANGVLGPGDSVPSSAEVDVICEPGFELDNGDTELSAKCTRGAWDTLFPHECFATNCRLPKTSHAYVLRKRANGLLGPGDSVPSSAEVDVICDPGFELDNGDTEFSAKCTRGAWDTLFPHECFAKAPCHPFEHFKNGTVTYTGDTIKTGTIAFIKCDPRADMEPDLEYVICLPKGEWNEKPRCLVRLPVKSDRKRQIRWLNGNRWFWVGQEQWIRSGGKIRVTCSRDYELYHNGYLVQTPKVCQNSEGTWRPPLPTCKEKRCDVPPFSYGHSEYENGTVAVGKVEHGVKLKTMCNELYEVKHHGTTTCDKGKLEKPSCIEKRCKLPKKTSAIVTYSRKGNPYGLPVIDHSYKINVGCTDKEYELRLRNKDTRSFEYPPDFSAVCHYGVLTEFPTCEEKRCNIKQFDQKKYTAIRYGDRKPVIVNIIESGVTVQLDCSEGYHLKDGRRDKEIDVRCSKGKLIGVIECEPDPCPKPNVPNAISEALKEEYPHDTQADIVCADGFEISPGKTQALATCSHGKWLAAPKECIEKQCAVRQIQGLEGVVNEMDKPFDEHAAIESRDSVYLKCKKDFESDTEQPLKVTCSKGDWSGSLDCTPKACPVKVIKNAAIEESGKVFPHLTNVTYICKSGFVYPDGHDKKLVTCEYGHWVDLPHRCSGKNCSISQIPNLENQVVYNHKGVKVDEHKVIKHRNLVTLQCKKGYRSSRKETRIHCKKGQWSGKMNCTEKSETTDYPSSGLALSCLQWKVNSFIRNNNVSSRAIDKIAHAKLLRKRTGDELGPTDSIPSSEEVKVTCNFGFELDNGDTELLTKCTRGEWDQTLPQECSAKRKNTNCRIPNPDIYSSGYFRKDKIHNSYIRHKRPIDVRCKSANNKGSLRTKCFNGDWDPKLPACDKNVKDCKLPHDAKYTFEDGNLSPGDKVEHGQLVSVACAIETFDYMDYGADYDHSHNASILCHHGTIFGLDDMKCEEGLTKECKNAVENGVVNASSVFGIIVKCNDGFKPNVPLSNEFQCLNGVVSTKVGQKEPKCIPEDCKLPDVLSLQVETWPRRNRPHYLSGSVVIKHMNTILLNCTDAGYEPFNRIIQCLAGKWSENETNWDLSVNETFPTCRPAECKPKCKHFGQCIRNNKCKCKRENEGARCEKFKCSALCIKNGGSCPDSVYCKCPNNTYGTNCEFSLTKECKNAVENGVVNASSVFGIIVKCNDGFKPNVPLSNEFQCLNGVVSTKVGQKEPKCIPEDCKLPDVLSLQVETWPRRNRPHYLSGSVVIKHMNTILLNCTDAGYEPFNRIIQCLAGKWSENETNWDLSVNETFPTCRPVKCSALCIKNGGSCPDSVYCKCPNNTYGTNCEFKRCQLPQNTAGIVSYTRNGNPYELTVIDHSAKIDVGCAIVEYELRLWNEDTQSFEYPSKFSATCHNGVLPEFPTCEEKRCNIQEFDIKNYSTVRYKDGKAVVVDMIDNGVTVQLSCSEGYHFKDGKTYKEIDVRCSKGKLIGGTECEPDGCGPPKTRAKVVNPHPTYKANDIAELTCDTGFQLEGDMHITCLESGEWSGSAVCVETTKKINYRVRITTGRWLGAGTNGDVFLKIYGKTGQQTKEIELMDGLENRTNKYERGLTDTFVVSLTDVGEISYIDIRLNAFIPVYDDWFLSMVSIHEPKGDKYYPFPAGVWLTKNNSKATLKLNKGYTTRQCGDTYNDARRMVIRGNKKGDPSMTVTECRMWCSEDILCNAVASFSNGGYCTLLYGTHLHNAYYHTRGISVFIRKFCFTG